MVLVGIVAFYVTIPFIEEAGLDLDIENLVFLTIIFTRVFGEFTLAIVEFQFFGDLSRQL